MVKAAHPDFVEVNEIAADLAHQQAGDLLAGVSQSNKRVVARLVSRAMDEGWSDAVLRGRIAEVVGLDPRSAEAVQNYRRGLAEAKVPPGRASRMVAAYAKRLRKHRAKVIAGTETRQALADAQREVWTRMQENGDVSRWAVRITRIHKDDRLCAQCRGENGKRRSLKRGATGGPPFHPSCRCYEELEDRGIEKSDGRLVGMDDVTKGRLNWSPKENWVDKVGGLPKYIEDIALALIRDRGMPRERAIKVAISRCKVWAGGGGDVDPDTRAKAGKAIAEWNAKRAKSKAQTAAKKD